MVKVPNEFFGPMGPKKKKGALLRAIVYTYTCWDQKVHIGPFLVENVVLSTVKQGCFGSKTEKERKVLKSSF